MACGSSHQTGESSVFLEQVYAQAKAGVDSIHPGVAHGALLAQGALLNGARMVRLGLLYRYIPDTSPQFMHPHVQDCTHSTVSKISLASDARVRHAAMRLVPVLAAYDTATFTGSDPSGTSVVGTKTSLFWAMTGLISRLDYPGDRCVLWYILMNRALMSPPSSSVPCTRSLMQQRRLREHRRTRRRRRRRHPTLPRPRHASRPHHPSVRAPPAPSSTLRATQHRRPKNTVHRRCLGQLVWLALCSWTLAFAPLLRACVVGRI